MATKDEPKIEFKATVTGADDWKEWCKNKSKGKAVNSNHSTTGVLYFFGLIGSMVYWLQAAVGFGAVVTGFLRRSLASIYYL